MSNWGLRESDSRFIFTLTYEQPNTLFLTHCGGEVLNWLLTKTAVRETEFNTPQTYKFSRGKHTVNSEGGRQNSVQMFRSWKSKLKIKWNETRRGK
jgi:hypothetical protein